MVHSESKTGSENRTCVRSKRYQSEAFESFNKNQGNVVKLFSIDCTTTFCSGIFLISKTTTASQSLKCMRNSYYIVQPRPFGNHRLIPWLTSKHGCTIILDLRLGSQIM